MELTNIQIEQLAPVLVSLGEVKHPMLSFRIAMMQQQVRPVLEALQKARQPDAAYQKYTKQRISLCEVYAKKDEAGSPMKERKIVSAQGGWQDNYVIEDLTEFTEKVSELEAGHKGALQSEAARQHTVVELLNAPSDLEFSSKIKYSWCKDHLTGNHLALLMACDVLDLDETPDGTPVVQGTPAVAVVKDTEE